MDSKKKPKRHLSKGVIWSDLMDKGLSAIIASVMIGGILILAAYVFFLSDDDNPYVGPPQEDAIFVDVAHYEIDNDSGSFDMIVNNDWLGISIIVECNTPCWGFINATSPSRIILSPFEFKSEDNSDYSRGDIISLNPDVWQGELYGQWNIDYFALGGPVYLTIQRVESFGASPLAMTDY